MSRIRETTLDIEDLRTFVEVADAGGVSPAARRLGVAKSIVSRRLGRIEAELGVQLLARTTRGAALTDAGTTFREHAARACAEIDAARETILPSGDLRGRLRIAAPLSFGPTHFASVLAEMARRHPQLHVHTAYSCVGPLYGKLGASPDYLEAHGAPEVPGDLAAHEALMQGTEAWQFMDGDEVITVHPRGRFKADNGTALIAAAVAGLGIAWLPDGLTRDYVASGALVPVMTRYPPPPAGIYVIRPPGQHPSLKVRALTELLIECFEQAPHLADVGG